MDLRCKWCAKRIVVMIMKGSGFCSELCKKYWGEEFPDG